MENDDFFKALDVRLSYSIREFERPAFERCRYPLDRAIS